MLSFNSIHNRNEIYLYAGDLSDELLMQGKQNKFVGLSIEKEDNHHISFDITSKFPLNDNSVDVFCAEDVMEHIEYENQMESLDLRSQITGVIFCLIVQLKIKKEN